MNCFYLNTINSILKLLHFYSIPNFNSRYDYYDYYDYWHYYCFYCYFYHCLSHYYFFIFNAFQFFYSRICHFILCLKSNIFKFQTYDVAEYCSKLTIKSGVCLNYSSDDLYLKWHIWSIMMLSFLYFCLSFKILIHIDRVSEKKRSIWNFKWIIYIKYICI